MNTTAVTLKAMQKIPEEEFGNIARMQYGISKGIEGKKAYVVSHASEEIGEDVSAGVFEHTYRAMHDYGMDVQDSERWAWLNTLFGYDIGDRESVRNVAELELGFHFNFAAFAKETPDAISYRWPEHI